MPTRRTRQRTPHYDRRRRVVKLGGVTLPYIIQDEFYSPLAAGTVDGTLAEPGPGTRNDVNNNTAIVAGELVIDSVTDILLHDESFARASGLAVLSSLMGADLRQLEFGFGAINTINQNRFIPRTAAADLHVRSPGGGNIAVGAVPNGAIPFQFAVIARTDGAFFAYRTAVANPWRLMFVSDAGNQNPVYAGAMGNGNAPNR